MLEPIQIEKFLTRLRKMWGTIPNFSQVVKKATMTIEGYYNPSNNVGTQRDTIPVAYQVFNGYVPGRDGNPFRLAKSVVVKETSTHQPQPGDLMSRFVEGRPIQFLRIVFNPTTNGKYTDESLVKMYDALGMEYEIHDEDHIYEENYISDPRNELSFSPVHTPLFWGKVINWAITAAGIDGGQLVPAHPNWMKIGDTRELLIPFVPKTSLVKGQSYNLYKRLYDVFGVDPKLTPESFAKTMIRLGKDIGKGPLYFKSISSVLSDELLDARNDSGIEAIVVDKFRDVPVRRKKVRLLVVPSLGDGSHDGELYMLPSVFPTLPGSIYLVRGMHVVSRGSSILKGRMVLDAGQMTTSVPYEGENGQITHSPLPSDVSGWTTTDNIKINDLQPGIYEFDIDVVKAENQLHREGGYGLAASSLAWFNYTRYSEKWMKEALLKAFQNLDRKLKRSFRESFDYISTDDVEADMDEYDSAHSTAVSKQLKDAFGIKTHGANPLDEAVHRVLTINVPDSFIGKVIVTRKLPHGVVDKDTLYVSSKHQSMVATIRKNALVVRSPLTSRLSGQQMKVVYVPYLPYGLMVIHPDAAKNFDADGDDTVSVYPSLRVKNKPSDGVKETVEISSTKLAKVKANMSLGYLLVRGAVSQALVSHAYTAAAKVAMAARYVPTLEKELPLFGWALDTYAQGIKKLIDLPDATQLSSMAASLVYKINMPKEGKILSNLFVKRDKAYHAISYAELKGVELKLENYSLRFPWEKVAEAVGTVDSTTIQVSAAQVTHRHIVADLTKKIMGEKYTKLSHYLSDAEYLDPNKVFMWMLGYARYVAGNYNHPELMVNVDGLVLAVLYELLAGIKPKPENDLHQVAADVIDTPSARDAAVTTAISSGWNVLVLGQATDAVVVNEVLSRVIPSRRQAGMTLISDGKGLFYAMNSYAERRQIDVQVKEDKQLFRSAKTAIFFWDGISTYTEKRIKLAVKAGMTVFAYSTTGTRLYHEDDLEGGLPSWLKEEMYPLQHTELQKETKPLPTVIADAAATVSGDSVLKQTADAAVSAQIQERVIPFYESLVGVVLKPEHDDVAATTANGSGYDASIFEQAMDAVAHETTSGNLEVVRPLQHTELQKENEDLPIVFISGSISITTIPQQAIERLDNVIKKNLPVVIGDAAGVDTLVQKYLHEKGYKNVTVYYAGNKVRNNVGGWSVKQVSSKNETGRDLYTLKDIQMTKDANYGLMLWDGKSSGTLSNINRMKSCGKKFVVINSAKHPETTSGKLEAKRPMPHKDDKNLHVVFISGSIGMTSIPKQAIEVLDNIIKKNMPVVIGNAAGVDTLVQKYLHEKGYKNVTVYYAGNKVRNNIGAWNTKQVPGKNVCTLKNIQMVKDANCALMIWNRRSSGVLNNIAQLKSQNKKFAVISPNHKISPD